jgi:hypothetical protein
VLRGARTVCCLISAGLFQLRALLPQRSPQPRPVCSWLPPPCGSTSSSSSTTTTCTQPAGLIRPVACPPRRHARQRSARARERGGPAGGAGRQARGRQGLRGGEPPGAGPLAAASAGC